MYWNNISLIDLLFTYRSMAIIDCSATLSTVHVVMLGACGVHIYSHFQGTVIVIKVNFLFYLIASVFAESDSPVY